MEYMIFAAVCLALCAAYCVALTLSLRKERQRQTRERDELAAALKSYVNGKIEGAEARWMEYRKDDLAELWKLEGAVRDLENGIVPDFEEAKKAAKAVNDFNTGISAIMGYDPMEARRKMREGRKGDAE